MNTILISYDLIDPGQDYQELYDYLKDYDGWCHPLESLWMIKTDKDHLQVRNEVKNLIDRNNKILVIDATGNEMAWSNLSKEASDWIKNN